MIRTSKDFRSHETEFAAAVTAVVDTYKKQPPQCPPSDYLYVLAEVQADKITDYRAAADVAIWVRNIIAEEAADELGVKV